MTEIDIACLPKDLPEFIEVDLSELDTAPFAARVRRQAARRRDRSCRIAPAIRSSRPPSCRRPSSRAEEAAAEGEAGGRRCRTGRAKRSRAAEAKARAKRAATRRKRARTTRRSNAVAGRARPAAAAHAAFLMFRMPTPIRLVAGLGNPGREYERTRHNAGFWFADALAAKLGATFAHEAQLRRATSRRPATFASCKPMTFMNAVRPRPSRRSPASSASRRTRSSSCTTSSTCRPGDAKMKLGGGIAGHNGLRDIHAQLGTADFWRLRLGIGHPRDTEIPEREVVDYVLKPPARDERDAIDAAIDARARRWPRHRAPATWSAR